MRLMEYMRRERVAYFVMGTFFLIFIKLLVLCFSTRKHNGD